MENLIKKLEELGRVNSEDFVKNLEDRKLEEIKHSDLIHAPQDMTGATDDKVKKAAKTRPVYETNIAVRGYINKWIKEECEGKVVIDIQYVNNFTGIFSFALNAGTHIRLTFVTL